MKIFNRKKNFLNNIKLLKEGKLNSWNDVTEKFQNSSYYKGSRKINRMREVKINRKKDKQNNNK